MKLLIASPSPFARKVRIALHEKGLHFDEIVDVPWSAGTAAPDHGRWFKRDGTERLKRLFSWLLK